MKTKSRILSTTGLSLAFAILALPAVATAKPDKTGKPEKPGKVKKHHLSFEKADADASGDLGIFEYASTLGPGVPLVEVRNRFLVIDTSGAFEPVLDPETGEPVLDPGTGEPLLGDPIPDGFVTREEIAAYRALENKPKSGLSRFELADFDNDSVLSPIEFSYLFSHKTPAKNTNRQFNRRDTNDDGELTPKEYKKKSDKGSVA